MKFRDVQLQQIEVAGAKKKFKVSDEHQPAWRAVPDSMWNDPRVIIERKVDGHRFKLHLLEHGNRLDSRRPSVDSGLYVEKTDNAPLIRDHAIPEIAGTVLDGELVAGKDSNSVAHALGSHATEDEKRAICYVAFDILFFKGEDMRERRDEVRRRLLEMLFEETLLGRCDNIKLMPRPGLTPDQKKQVLVDALDAGEEGVMLKDASQPYGKGWTKVKREARYDVIVMGYEEPKPVSVKKGDAEATPTKFALNSWIGAIQFGQLVGGKLTYMGRCSGMDEAVRKEVSENRDAFLGRVMEISAQERFPKTGKFRHPRFERWRDGEKLAEDCVYDPNEI